MFYIRVRNIHIFFHMPKMNWNFILCWIWTLIIFSVSMKYLMLNCLLKSIEVWTLEYWLKWRLSPYDFQCDFLVLRWQVDLCALQFELNIYEELCERKVNTLGGHCISFWLVVGLARHTETWSSFIHLLVFVLGTKFPWNIILLHHYFIYPPWNLMFGTL